MPALKLSLKPLDVSIERSYAIRMHNRYYSSTGKVGKEQWLETTYSRQVSQIIDGIYALTELHTDKVTFESDTVNKMPWTFAQNLVIPYVLFTRPSSDRELILENPDSLYQQMDKVNDIFRHLPMTNSVHLFMMQVLDMITFESFVSQLSTLQDFFEEWHHYYEVPSLSGESYGIHMGQFDGNSMFHNGTFEVRIIGMTQFKERECFIVEYQCHGSKVKMSSKDSDHQTRTRYGGSAYRGTMYLDVEDSSLKYATMYEDYRGVQKNNNSEKSAIKKSLSVVRYVEMEEVI